MKYQKINIPLKKIKPMNEQENIRYRVVEIEELVLARSVNCL